VLDAKWKKDICNDGKDPKHGVTQGDIYQLYSYGRKFGCGSVVLIYPRTRTFRSPLRYEFKDKIAGQGLTLFCFPFDVVQPEKSVCEIMQRLKANDTVVKASRPDAMPRPTPLRISAGKEISA